MKLRCWGLLVLLLLAGCPNSDQTWARNVAEGYLKNVFEGNLDAAGIYTTSDFKYDQDGIVMRDLLKGHTWTIESEKLAPSGDEAFFDGSWDAKPGKGAFTVRVVKQDKKWRVDRFTASKH